jgi:SAM-dependent methyltransferase
MKSTELYYEAHHAAFIRSTVEVDMSELYQSFISKLPIGASILDVGCGSGRDLKWFREQGYQVLGLEPVNSLASFAREHSGSDVIETDIEGFQTEQQFDGIWACASLLHLDDKALSLAFRTIADWMHDESILYCSFKLGEFKGERNGRYFNDQTELSIADFLGSSFEIKECWRSTDSRTDREDLWLNLILCKTV